MTVDEFPSRLDLVHEYTARWARLWKLPGLEHDVNVRFDARLERSLGSCSPARGVIRLHPDLKAGSRELLLEVLCHEFAHVAVTALHEEPPAPHGREWADLVRAAGYPPRTRLAGPPGADTGGTAGSASTGSPGDPRLLYEHACPVCHYSRIARRHVPSWRCPECSRAGEEATLVVRTRPARPR